MSKALKFLKKYWYIPLFAVVSVLVYLFFRRGNSGIFDRTMSEIAAIEAGAQTEIVVAEKGVAAALIQVEKDYTKNLRDLDAEKRKQAAELRNDPVKLAKFLVRASTP